MSVVLTLAPLGVKGSFVVNCLLVGARSCPLLCATIHLLSTCCVPGLCSAASKTDAPQTFTVHNPNTGFHLLDDHKGKRRCSEEGIHWAKVL